MTSPALPNQKIASTPDRSPNPKARPTHGGNRNWAAQLAHCDPSDILDFSASINPLGTPESVLTAIQTNLHLLNAYPDPSYGTLRATLSQFHGVPEDWILPGNGAAELLTWIGRELAELPCTYLMAPGFADYHRAIASFNGKTQLLQLNLDALLKQASSNEQLPSPVNHWGCCPELEQAIALANSTASCGILINNPHNPTGALLSREMLQPLLERFALVVVDEAFMDFLPPAQQESVIDWVQEWPNVVVVRSLTKFYSLPGLRLGYVVAHPRYLQRWQQWRDPWPVNILAEVAAIAALKDQPFQQRTWEWLAPTRTRLYQELNAMSGLTPFAGAANFLLVKTDTPSSHLQRLLLQSHQVLIRDCLSFVELGDRYFRVAVRLQTENQRLLDGLLNVINSVNA